MEFRLIYSGPLHAETKRQARAEEKHKIRKVFHRQLSELWKQHPVLQRQAVDRLIRYRTPLNMISDPGPGVEQIMSHRSGKPWLEIVADDHARLGYRFVPLVRKAGGFTCSLDILFLRRDNPGSLVHTGGDIDNRIKVLLDGLRTPNTSAEIGGFLPEVDENPFHCLLEDDSLITALNITTDRLLLPVDESAGERKNDVHLVIHVRLGDVEALFAGNRLI
jgi:hypothetical protein